MAVITFNDVYRSGSSVGSPVAAYFVCDTEAEVAAIATKAEGDIAYSKDRKILYYWHGTGWAQVVTGGVNIDVPFTSSNFFTDNGTWIINNYNTYSYNVTSKVMTLWFHLVGTTNMANSNLYIRLPAGYTCSKLVGNALIISSGATQYNGYVYLNVGGTILVLNMPAAIGFPTGTFTVFGQLSLPLQ